MAYVARMHRFARRLALALAAGSLSVAALAGPAAAEDKWVTMFGFEYRPSTVTVEPGDTVTFVNDDEAPHDAVGDGWATELLTQGDSDAVVFSAAGTYAYTCSIHPDMRGTVVVQATSGGGGGGGGGNPTITDPPTDTVDAADVQPVADPYLAAFLGVAAGLVAFGLVVVRRAARPA